MLKLAKRRQAGVAGDETSEVRAGTNLMQPIDIDFVVQRIMREAPARQRFGVAVNDAESLPADFGHGMHRQCGNSFGDRGKITRRGAQMLHDLIGSLDIGVIDIIRIRAAATGFIRIG